MAEPRKTAVRLGTSFDCGDGLTFGYKREVESFRLSVGKLMVTVHLGALPDSPAACPPPEEEK